MRLTCSFVILLLLSASKFSFGQMLDFKIPTKAQAKIGSEFSIRISVTGISNYSLTMKGNPPSAQLLGNQFTWTPKKTEKNQYVVTFQLLDSTKSLINESDLEIMVTNEPGKPLLVFEPALPDTIEVTENKAFSLTATIKSSTKSSTQSITPYFIFNEDPNLRAFDSCQLTRMGDILIFRWTPSNREALTGYAKLRITLVDENYSVNNRVLNFKITNINTAPYFINPPPDTLFISSNQEATIDFSAKDDDNDNITYDYTPKSPSYFMSNGKLIFKPVNSKKTNIVPHFPWYISVTISDGVKSTQRSIYIKENKPFEPLAIGDFTKKVFSEGDSISTYLNISGGMNLKQVVVKFTDLSTPPGVSSLSGHLQYERGDSFIKVYSKGIIPYYLVDHDYTYNIAVSISDKNENWKSSSKILELTIRDRPNPAKISLQRDSVLADVEVFFSDEKIYQSNLSIVYNKIAKPWWKKVAVVTGTLSGVLSIVQSQEPNKTISTTSAAISLVSIMVTTLPGLSEKKLSELSDKIASSKNRTERVSEKVAELKSNWSWDNDHSSFKKEKQEIVDLLAKSKEKQLDEVCSLLQSHAFKKRIFQLIAKAKNKDQEVMKKIFSCQSQ